jgi:hypothetical protein
MLSRGEERRGEERRGEERRGETQKDRIFLCLCLRRVLLDMTLS